MRLSAAGSVIFLRSLLARPFRGQTAARHRSARTGARQVAPRGRTRPATSRHFCAHGGLPPSRPCYLRYLGGFRRSPSARSVTSFFLAYLPPGEFRMRPFLAPSSAAISPVLSFRSKTVRQPNRARCDLTDLAGQVSQNDGDSSDLR